MSLDLNTNANLTSGAPNEGSMVGANGQTAFDTLLATGNSNYVPPTGADSFGYSPNTFASARNLSDIANQINSNTGFSTAPDVFGNPALSTNGLTLNMGPPPSYGIHQGSQYNTYSENFGMLASYFGPSLNAAPDMGQSPGNREQQVNKSGNLSINTGINYALPEEQNTFGTPEYFRALAQQIAPAESLSQQAQDIIGVAKVLHGPEYQAMVPSAENFLAQQDYQKGFVNFQPGGGTSQDYHTGPTQAQYQSMNNPAPLSDYQPITTYSSWSPVLPMQGGQDPLGTGHLYGMLPGERFLGSGTGDFISPDFSQKSYFNSPPQPTSLSFIYNPNSASNASDILDTGPHHVG